MKLYMVKLRGFSGSTSTKFDLSYVVANDPEVAYRKVRDFLDGENLGFGEEREMESITLLAETGSYPDCKTILFD